MSLLTFFWAVGYRSIFLQIKNKGFLILSFIFLILSLQLFFITRKIFFLYITFELSVIPIFIIITGWGYQSERLDARLSLIFYTLAGSMPLLLVILWLISKWSWGSFLIIIINFRPLASILGPVLGFSALIAFAVKLPMFGVHIWLPKAHVEAPVIGSIILAAILLKLGSYGIWVMGPLVYTYFLTGVWVSISLIGAVVIRVLCIRLRDVKIIIAYSSVSHMALVISALILNNFLGSTGALILILAHGARSSGIFLISFILYQRNHSRSLLLTKGILTWSRAIPVFWFLILISNIAAPPTFNLISEIITIGGVILRRNLNSVLLILIVLLGTTYSLIIYSSTVQGRGSSPNSTSHPRPSDLLSVFNHLLWVGLIMYSLGVVNV